MRKKIFIPALYLMIVAAFPVIAQSDNPAFSVSSPAFKDGGMIPKKYTCDDKDISPQLAWTNAPSGTKSFALICEDPDAPGAVFTHWVVYNIPAASSGLKENTLPSDTLVQQGKNDFGKTGYGGPCPPGGTHRYIFKIYALDKILSSSVPLSKNQLLNAMKNHVLGETSVTGKYYRQ